MKTDNMGISSKLMSKIISGAYLTEKEKEKFISALQDSPIYRKALIQFCKDKNNLGTKFDTVFTSNFFTDMREDASGLYEKGYPCISLGCREFVNILNIIPISKQDKFNFLDVGSGFGHKLFLSLLFSKFNSVTGIEYVRSYIQEAYRLLDTFLPNNLACMKRRDALQFDYSEYNFIYMFRPLTTAKEMAKLYTKIFETAPVGAIIVDAMWGYRALEIADVVPEGFFAKANFYFYKSKYGFVQINY